MVTARIFGTAGQLAIRKRAGPPFSELHIALRIELSAGPERADAASACLHAGTAFKDDGTIALLCQQQGSEHAGRAKADHGRSVLQRLIPLCRQGERFRMHSADITQMPLQQRRFMAHFACQRI